MNIDLQPKAQYVSLLLVDDDLKFCRITKEYLSIHGFKVTCINNGNNALEAVQTGQWEAVILDVMLPGSNGYQILRRIREVSEIPVVLLTALGDQERERIIGLEIGADDYLSKSGSPRELLARINAVLRRNRREMNHVNVNGLSINVFSRMVYVDDKPVWLTPLEFELLLALAQSKGRTKTREQLLQTIRDENFEASDRSIDVHVAGLRKKLDDDSKNPRFIRTVRSAGYMLISRQDAL